MRLFQTKLKRLQEADYDNDDFAIGSTVDNNDEDDFWDTISYQHFQLFYKDWTNFFWLNDLFNWLSWTRVKPYIYIDLLLSSFITHFYLKRWDFPSNVARLEGQPMMFLTKIRFVSKWKKIILRSLTT